MNTIMPRHGLPTFAETAHRDNPPPYEHPPTYSQAMSMPAPQTPKAATPQATSLTTHRITQSAPESMAIRVLMSALSRV
ncbi:hypothetical protein C4J95_3837 [Pseudomonas orientalis]|uniref:hypothetical protein n=1 Tax=Pseudomonas orientalis TaxID=76758 RepID=UPI000F5897BB|nr:hypothetical protein [Pseudomonas orientalis]AZE95865.1 hypothetical protein C4J96_3766 [Pseudomonas orientalis]AZF01282.1 hypothetical protein C4J95_3837 [Pseudomonas orientalis]